MSSKPTESKRLAELLRAVASRLDSDPDFLKNILKDSTGTRKPLPEKETPSVSLFEEILCDEAGLLMKLQDMELSELRAIVSEKRLDTTGKVRRWKTKNKVVDFIMEEARKRSRVGGTVLSDSDEGGR
jgi:hypothetical protein